MNGDRDTARRRARRMLSLDRPRKRHKTAGGVVVTAITSHFGGTGGPAPLSPMAMATRPQDWTAQQAQMILGSSRAGAASLACEVGDTPGLWTMVATARPALIDSTVTGRPIPSASRTGWGFRHARGHPL